jgi:hypothetical protein
MAASTYPAPGTTFGPCAPRACSHLDCSETRARAAELCRLCGEPIGYDRRFYRDPADPAADVHATCLEDGPGPELVTAKQNRACSRCDRFLIQGSGYFLYPGRVPVCATCHQTQEGDTD